MIVDEGWRSGSLAAEIGTRIVEQAFWELDAPIGRVCSEEVPIPYPRHLEERRHAAGAEDRRGREGACWRVRERAVAEFRMPSLGADMEAGTLVEWLVKPGDRVKRGDIVAVVETQKGAIEIEIFETGRIDQILVGLGTQGAGRDTARADSHRGGEAERPLRRRRQPPPQSRRRCRPSCPSLLRRHRLRRCH